MTTLNKKNVFVAMSGGVDSSVAAALIKKQGYNVVGVFMKPWQSQSPTSNFQLPTSCLWERDREDALRVAAKLDIPLLTWDLSDEYEKKVTKYMVDGYRSGITPNPDIMCNKHIKFGAFLKWAIKEGADYIATGHYVRLRWINSKHEIRNPKQIKNSKSQTYNLKPITYSLLKAKDLNKDQSYFLYTLTQKQLRHCLFPIGNYTKPQVRQLAKKFGLPNWDKKDSQGVCFVGDLEMEEFLKQSIPSKKGKIIRVTDGTLLGEHQGAWYYTIGQRHGLNIKGNGQIYFVTGKDIKNNVIYVDLEKSQSALYKKRLILKNFSWVGEKLKLPTEVRIKNRYRQIDQKAVLYKKGDVFWALFRYPQRAVTPGQSAVVYKKEQLIGGGVIV